MMHVNKLTSAPRLTSNLILHDSHLAGISHHSPKLWKIEPPRSDRGPLSVRVFFINYDAQHFNIAFITAV